MHLEYSNQKAGLLANKGKSGVGGCEKESFQNLNYSVEIYI